MTERLHPDGLPVDATPGCNAWEAEGLTIDKKHRALEERARLAEADLAAGRALFDAAKPIIGQSMMNLRDWVESGGALCDGARIGWASVEWRVSIATDGAPCSEDGIVNDETGDSIGLGACASLPASGWRFLP